MPARFGQTVAGFAPESLPNHAVNILRLGSPPAPIAILRSASGLPGINTSSPPLPAFILLPFFHGLKKKPTRVAWKNFPSHPGQFIRHFVLFIRHRIFLYCVSRFYFRKALMAPTNKAPYCFFLNSPIPLIRPNSSTVRGCASATLRSVASLMTI